MDLDLPFILRHENIARIEKDGIHILDRRVYPFERKEFVARDYREAASAIKDMVTQGGGPLEVALVAMLQTYKESPSDLESARALLASSRPTNTTMKRALDALMERYNSGEDFEEVVSSIFESFDSAYNLMSDIGASLLSDGMGVLTTCFPEHTFLLSVKKAVDMGKRIRVYVPETRPYFQGSHLTEPCLRELGIECYLVTDGMPAHFMAKGDVDIYMTAADLALEDRTVVNKTGTLSNAIACNYYGIPYYAFSMGLDPGKERKDISLEYRSGEEILFYKGFQIAEKDAKALYPCFDVVPSELVAGIITKEGII